MKKNETFLKRNKINHKLTLALRTLAEICEPDIDLKFQATSLKKILLLFCTEG